MEERIRALIEFLRKNNVEVTIDLAFSSGRYLLVKPLDMMTVRVRVDADSYRIAGVGDLEEKISVETHDDLLREVIAEGIPF